MLTQQLEWRGGIPSLLPLANVALRTGQSKPVSTSRRRVWLFRALALALPLLLLLALEVGLRWAQTGYPSSFLVPANNRPGVMVDNYKFSWRFFPRALARSPQPIATREVKPSDTIRLIVFGGSAAMGDPDPDFGVCRVLQALLEPHFPRHKVEVINAAVTAINSHVVLSVARDCRRLHADGWIFYLGNNEVHGPFGAGTVFGTHERPRWMNHAGLAFQRTKIGQGLLQLRRPADDVPKAWGGLQMFKDQQVPHSSASLRRVYRDFEANYRDLLALAPKGNIVLASTMLTNLRDFPPLMSRHADTLTAADRELWQGFFSAGVAAQQRDDFRLALKEYEQAQRLDRDYAELSFRIGECHLAMGQVEQARASFQQACDHDALRFRADTTLNEIVRTVARQATSATLVDVSEQVGRQSKHGIPGDDLLFEHVHLKFHGNYLLARAWAEALVEARHATPGRWLSEAEVRERLGYTVFHERGTWEEVRHRLRQPPFSDQIGHLDRDRRLTEGIRELSSELNRPLLEAARRNYRRQIEAHPEEWPLRRQFAVLLDSAGDLPGAIDEYREIIKTLPHHPEPHFRLGALYNRTKQWPEAERHLRQALELRSDFARAANSLGICLSHQGRFEHSYEQFRHAVEVQPTFAEAFFNWGLVLASQGKQTDAEQYYRKAIDADVNYVPAYAKLGAIAVAATNYQAALPFYQEVARLRPGEPEAQLTLGKLYLRMGETAKARKQLERTLTLDPQNHEARVGIQQLNRRGAESELVQ